MKVRLKNDVFFTALYFSSYQKKQNKKTAQMSGFSLIMKRQKLG